MNQLESMETTCGSLLIELQRIWDEVGESEAERDKMILEIEQECLAVYSRKVDEAKICRAQLQRTIAHSKAEIADICSSLGEQSVKSEWKSGGNMREELGMVIPQLEGLRKRKLERMCQFVELLVELQNVSKEISSNDNRYDTTVDETDLSGKRLEELRGQLLDLQNEKSARVKRVLDYLSKVKSLCSVIGLDYKETICNIHPTLEDSVATVDISNRTIEKLATKIEDLQDMKKKRVQKLQSLASTLLELWDLMDTPIEEQQPFLYVSRNIVASEKEITEPSMLSMDSIKSVEDEVYRLEQFRSSKMKEIVMKKQLELEDICRKTHMVTERQENSIEAIESGSVDPFYLLEQIELQIAHAKEESLSRREILDKVEKWFSAREEECWLEEYNRDDNRYNAGRGTHLNLKRAERARTLTNKLPAMVEALISKVSAWEKERGIQFSYDGVQLLDMLKDYMNMRQEKELEKQRQRDQKKLQGQLMATQEALYGSKPSPQKSVKKSSRPSSITNNRKLSLGGALLQAVKPEKTTPRVHFSKLIDSVNQNSSPLSRQKSSGFTSQSGRRISEIGGGGGPIVKKNTSVKPTKSPMSRNPLSPVSLAMSSKLNIMSSLDDKQRTQNRTCDKTPNKFSCVGNDENITPKTMPIPIPSTPSTLSVPMMTALTPATPHTCGGIKQFQNQEDVEYSFEEVRAGFICS